MSHASPLVSARASPPAMGNLIQITQQIEHDPPPVWTHVDAEPRAGAHVERHLASLARRRVHVPLGFRRILGGAGNRDVDGQAKQQKTRIHMRKSLVTGEWCRRINESAASRDLTLRGRDFGFHAYRSSCSSRTPEAATAQLITLAQGTSAMHSIRAKRIRCAGASK